MIDMRTRFFAVASVLCFSLILVAPKELKYVPFWVGVVYIFLTSLCALDSISKHASKR